MKKRGFTVNAFHGDNEFNIEKLHQHLDPHELHIYAWNEHVGMAENGIKTIKERARCICHASPYTKYPKIMITNMIKHIIRNLNDFPSKKSVAQLVSPATIVKGIEKPNLGYKRVSFGIYVIAWIRTTNNMQARAVPAKYLENQTGKVDIISCCWTQGN